MPSLHSSRARRAVLSASLVACAGICQAQPSATQASAATASTFTVFVKSVPVGTERSTVARTAGGWTITGNGRLGPPLDVITRNLEVRYDADWKPLSLSIDASTRGQVNTLKTEVSGTIARSQISSAGAPSERNDTIDAAAILLPNLAFAPYEAVAARLHAAAPGTKLAVYIVPFGSASITSGTPVDEQIQTVSRTISARRTPITLEAPPGPPVAGEVWSDESGRLLRVSVPAQNLEVVREDIGSVSSRRVTVSRPNDEQVRVQANGFSIAATLSKPADADGKSRPAVVLAAGAGPTDRDETVAGIPIFGQIASALADAGFYVLRYDNRGVGQSGGRPEAATLDDYAEDLRAVVRYLGGRKDVDRRRIAVVGYADGGPVALIAASKDDRIAAAVLIASIGTNGADATLGQLSVNLEQSKRSAAEKEAALALQKQIQTAVLTGSGWEGVSPEVRRQAETPWFHSVLSFDPARIMRNVNQPLLILHGSLDTQVAPTHADNLEQLARGRRRGTVEVAKVPGINHLLVPAQTGSVDEYGTLADRTVSASVTSALASWLQKTMPAAVR
jgi:pimeloyl-ACP methyl ester carboxylesterase